MNKSAPSSLVTKKRKRKKKRLNITLSPLSRRYGVMMQKKDNRNSLTNMLEHLIFEERDRRNISFDDLKAFEKKKNGKNKHKGKHNHEHHETKTDITRWQSKN